MIELPTIGGKACVLLLVQPDWGSPVRMKLGYESKLVTGKTRRENRQPQHLILRMAQRFTMVLSPELTTTLRQLIATQPDILFAVPAWADQRYYADYANRYFDSEYWVTYSEDYESYAVNTGTYENYVPLMFGKPTSDTLKAFRSDSAEGEFAIVEDVADSHKIEVRSGVEAPTSWPTDLIINWEKDPTEKHDTGLEYDKSGKGRERHLTNPETTFRWNQAAHLTMGYKSQVFSFLNFWNSVKGRIGSFDSPMFLQSGISTPEVPHVSKFRFGGAEVSLSFDHPGLCETDLRFIQVPWEINPVAGEVPEQPAEATLFRFDYDAPGKASEFFTDWESVIPFDSESFLPHQVELKTLDKDLKLQRLDAVLEWRNEGANPLMAFVSGGLERMVRVTIYQGDPAAPTGMIQRFKGTLQPVKTVGRKMTTKFKAFGGSLVRRLPGFDIQRGCNYSLGDRNCGLDLETIKNTGTGIVADLSADGLNLFVRDLTGDLSVGIVFPGVGQWDRWGGGFLELGSGDDYQIRTIVKSDYSAFSDRKIYFDRPLDGVKLANTGIPAALTLYPGCGGTKAECQSSAFDNYNEFGGHPYSPDQLNQLQGSNNAVGGK